MTAYSARRLARKHGYRSGLEDNLATYLKEHRVKFLYEKVKIEWEDLAYRTYTPDFILPNGIIIETKGRFIAIDRRKHICIKRQHPELDIRFVFMNARNKIYKGSKTTYADWCNKHDYRWAEKSIPVEWYKNGK